MGGGGSTGGAGTYFSTPGAAMGAAQNQLGGGWNSGAFLQGVGKGLGNFGSALSSPSPVTPMGDVPQMSQGQVAPEGAMPPTAIQGNDITEALVRLLGGSSNTSQGAMVPSTGAANYWYVDPRANAPSNVGNLGLLPEGAVPSF